MTDFKAIIYLVVDPDEGRPLLLTYTVNDISIRTDLDTKIRECLRLPETMHIGEMLKTGLIIEPPDCSELNSVVDVLDVIDELAKFINPIFNM